MKFTITIIFFICSISCISQRENTARTRMVRSNEEQFKAQAKSFIDNTQDRDIDTMLAMTSKITINKDGEKKVINNYKYKVIPSFYSKKISWEGQGRVIYDHRGNAGFMFQGLASGESEFVFYVTVFGEGGNYVIGSISR